MRNLTIVLCTALLGLAAARPARAQVVNPTAILFSEPDQTTVIPPGQLNAGQPTISSYQALILLAAADAATGTILQTGAVVPKTSVLNSGDSTAPYQINFSQAGLTIPPCTALPCQQYTVVLLAIGPGGTSARGVTSESPSFTATVPGPSPTPAAPANVKVK